jgi:hypothetical protein
MWNTKGENGGGVEQKGREGKWSGSGDNWVKEGEWNRRKRKNVVSNMK